MNEAVDRLIAERERMDAGFSGTFWVSVGAHVALIAAAVALPLVLPREPPLRVLEGGFAVVLPRGGGGSPTATQAPAPAPIDRPAPQAPPAPVAPPPKVLKPPKEAPRPNALPMPDARRTARRTPEPAAPSTSPRSTAPASPAAAGVRGGSGTGSDTLGIGIGPPGPGVPDGTDTGGDWYLAGVQQKIWMLWNQQLKTGFNQQILVTFTILPDGSVKDVKVTQPSGVSLLDMAAQRAVLNAAPFGPLPREYGQNPRTIQALFRPTS